jgi:hypothetical protein
VPAELPKAPFSDWPVQHFDPLVGFFWFARPAAFVSQSIASHGSLAVIERQNDLMDQVLSARAEEIRAAGGLLVFNDWRSVRSYDQDARARQRERMRARPSGYSRRTIIVVDPASRLLRMAVEAANLFATLTLRARIEVVLHAGDALSRAALTPPAANEAFPG